MEKQIYETIIEVLAEKLRFTEWQLGKAEEEAEALRKENAQLRSEK